MTQNLPSDIWPQVQQGDKGAYAELYTYYYKHLFNYGRKFTEEVTIIEDAIQEVFITFWICRDKLSGVSSPHSYLLYSFRNSIFKKLKQQRKWHEWKEYPQSGPEFSIEAIIISSEMSDEWQLRLQSALRALTSRQKEAIFLRFYEGMTYEQVAEVMNITVKAAYKIMARALLQLKELLSVPMILLLMLLKDLSF
jgi:RNA polymerase sigma factor (sigma-70 family)